MDRELMVSMLDMDDWVFGGDYSVSHHVDMATGTILDASCIRSCPEIVEYGVVEVSARRGDVEITFREGVSFVIGEPESLTTEYGDETYEPDVKSRWSVLQAGRPFNVISEGNIEWASPLYVRYGFQGRYLRASLIFPRLSIAGWWRFQRGRVKQNLVYVWAKPKQQVRPQTA